MMAAATFKSPELALEKDEADALAAAIAEVEALYSFSMSAEQRAWMGLAATAAMVYGPRAYMIAQRRRKEKGEPKRQPVPKASQIKAPKVSDDPDAPKPAGPLSPADFGL